MPEPSPLVEEAYAIVRQIPVGRVMNYGLIGQLLSTPVSGKLIGAWLRNSQVEGLPWWRVVGKDGHFPVGRIDPFLQKMQIDLLTEEGVKLTDHQVDMTQSLWEPG